MGSAASHLRIIHTNDIHSHFEHMPSIATTVQVLKQDLLQDQVLVVDIGDHMDRMSPLTEGSEGLANIEVMNKTGYELAVLGNNEGLTFSKDVLRELYTNYAEFDIIVANMFDATECRLPDWILPYQVIHKAGMNIGVIGVTVDFNMFYKLLGWDVHDPFVIVEQLVMQLRPQVDLLIVLSHLGINRDRELAERMDGIDIILGGHTHHLLLEPEWVEETLICGAGKFGTHVGYVDVYYDTINNERMKMSGGCVETSAHLPDHDIQTLIQKHQVESRQKLQITVAVIEKRLSIDWHEESPLGNLLAAGIRKWTKSDISIVNAGQILQSLLPGQITREIILALCPSPINPCKMQLSGEQIVQALEETLIREKRDQRIVGYGFRGNTLGMLCVDGLRVYYHPDGKPMHKIQRAELMESGRTIERDQTYTVGTLDMFTFGVGHLSLREGKDIEFYLPEFIRDVLLWQLRNEDELERCQTKRWLPLK